MSFDGLRIEARLRDRERDAQHLVRVGLRGAARQRHQRRDAGEHDERDGTAHHSAFSMSPAIDSGVSFGA